MINAGLFTSNTDEWATPQDFFDKLNAEFHFDLDVCATKENAKCKRYFTKEQNGLKQEWKGICWMNPPYGRQISLWVYKALESARGGGDSCLPSPCPHRYSVVAFLCHRSRIRDPLHKRKTEIRERKTPGSLPFGCCHIQRRK